MTARPRSAASASLVGRHKELERLRDLLARPPGLAVVEGEAGIGKTRLVRELTAPGRVPQRLLVLTGYCQPVREPFPFGPLAEAISGAAASLEGRDLGPGTAAAERILPELRHLLPAPPEPLGDPRAERHATLRALRELLAGIGPALLVLEDLHWADEATIELLSLLRTGFPPELMVVGTCRGEELETDSPLRTLCSRLPAEVSGEHLVLDPLDVSEVGELVSAILGTEEVSEEFATYLRERTSGVPFAVEEVVALLRDREAIVREGKTWVRKDLEELGVPPTLAESILERLGRLPSGARRIVEAGAVLGTPASERLMATVADLPPQDAVPASTEALASALLQDEPGGRIGFRHPLAMQAVHDSIPGPKRRAMHLRAARELEAADPEPLARLAHHFREAGEADEWVRYAEEAADLAADRGDDAAAFVLLSEVIDSQVGSGSRARIAVKLGRAAYHSRAYGEAATVLRRILAEEVLDPGERGELRLLLGLLLDRLEDDQAAYAQIERAVGELEGDHALQARAMAALAIPTFGEPHVSEHVEWARRASGVVARVEDPVLRMAVLANQAAVLLATGATEAWGVVDQLPSGRTAPERRERIRCCHNIANEALGIGRFDRAEVFLEEAEAVSREASYDRLSVDLKDIRAYIDWATGRWDGLEGRCRQLLSEEESNGAQALHSEIVLAVLLLARGELRDAGGRLQRAADHARSRGAGMEHSWAKGALARVLMAQNGVEGAVDEALEGVEPLRRKGLWSWAFESVPPAVEALLAHGRHGDATRLVQEFSAGLKGREAPAADAALAMCRGLVAAASGAFAAAGRWYGRSARKWGSMPRPHDLARALEARGIALLSAGDPVGATALEEALDAFEGLGATWDAQRTRRTLRDHGVRLVHRRGRRGYGQELSPREREVAGLAGRGLTNREIAGRLFLSLSTVKQHISSVLRKLGKSSRAELRVLDGTAE